MKRARTTQQIREHLRRAELERKKGRLASATTILEKIAKTDDGFVLVADQLLLAYQEQLFLPNFRKAKSRHFRRLIEETDRRRSDLVDTHGYSVPYEQFPGPLDQIDIIGVPMKLTSHKQRNQPKITDASYWTLRSTTGENKRRLLKQALFKYRPGLNTLFADTVGFGSLIGVNGPLIDGPHAAITGFGKGGADIRWSTTETISQPKFVGFTPHIDTMPAPERSEIIVKLFLDSDPFRLGEVGQRVLAKVGSTVQSHLITSQHFQVQGEASRSFVVEEATRTITFGDFILKKELRTGVSGEPFIGAVFTVDGNICGNVKRIVDLDGRTNNIAAADEPLDLSLDGGEPADLSVAILQLREGEYACLVISPHLDQFKKGKSNIWNLSGRAETIVSGYMNRFTAPNTKPNQLIAELRGAGKLLFRDAPSVFKEAFWLLVENDLPLRSVAILSEEPFVPWELMVPTGGPDGKSRDLALGAECNVGRWIYQTKTPTRDLTLVDSKIIAPKYAGENALLLAQAKAEARAVAKAFAGKVISPATFEKVSDALRSRSSLLHFVCHGKDERDDGQVLLLDDSDSLTASNLIGIDGVAEAFRAKAPVVFINACEVGRGSPSLIGTRNFASQFIQLGAKAVIAPLWSVDDAVAHDVALTFYKALKSTPEKPFAEILRDIRKKAYATGIDTYAAYCFFGHPRAAAV